MEEKRTLVNNPGIRILQHLLFWIFSFFVFLYVFKIGSVPAKIDYVFTGLFHLFILPAVYFNNIFLFRKLKRAGFWFWIIVINLLILILLSWLTEKFFSDWSAVLLPDYFFISYFSFLQISLFFVFYLGITTLLKFSKSWFIVNRLQNELLIAEQKRTAQQSKLLELEAKALRAQMNPHFIFNCINSIKGLMQEQQTEKGVTYLTIFSKLIRTLFNNADKKEISLFDEIETCKLYMELEAMRFDGKFTYDINVDQTVDLKSVPVPALIIQPFIENSIWHGLVPQEIKGRVVLNVDRKGDWIEISVEDNGIGREASQRHKADARIGHVSKGVNLTQSRLELSKILQKREINLKIIDKKDQQGRPGGTRVVITFDHQ